LSTEHIINNVNSVLKQYPIKRAALFGSYARGEHRDDSDIDLVVEIEKGEELIFFTLWDEIEEIKVAG